MIHKNTKKCPLEVKMEFKKKKVTVEYCLPLKGLPNNVLRLKCY